MEKEGSSIPRTFWAYGVDRSSQESSLLSSTQPSQMDHRTNSRVQRKFDEAFASKRHTEIIASLTGISNSISTIEKALPVVLKELTKLNSTFEKLSQDLRSKILPQENFIEIEERKNRNDNSMNAEPCLLNENEEEVEESSDDEERELEVMSVADYLKSRKRRLAAEEDTAVETSKLDGANIRMRPFNPRREGNKEDLRSGSYLTADRDTVDFSSTYNDQSNYELAIPDITHSLYQFPQQHQHHRETQSSSSQPDAAARRHPPHQHQVQQQQQQHSLQPRPTAVSISELQYQAGGGRFSEVGVVHNKRIRSGQQRSEEHDETELDIFSFMTEPKAYLLPQLLSAPASPLFSGRELFVQGSGIH